MSLERVPDRHEMSVAPSRRPLRVLAQPAYRNRDENPYTSLLYSHLGALDVQADEFSWHRALFGRYDIWHLHWPESYPNKRSLPLALRQSAGLLALLSWARRRGTRIVWTVHNLASHERVHPAIDRWFGAAFMRRVDTFVALSEAGARLARRRHPHLEHVPNFVVPHGHYRHAYPNTLTRAQARAELGVPEDATVVTFVGQIRRYKNVPALAEAFRRIQGEDLRLLIAGRPQDAAVEADVRRASGEDDRIHLHCTHLRDEEIHLPLSAANLIVLPYGEVLNSGSALLALSFDRPVLVPRRGALEDLRRQVGDAWVRTYDGALTPEILSAAITWSRRARGSSAPLDAFEWARVADATRAVYSSALATGGRRVARAHAPRRSGISPARMEECTRAL